MCSFLSCTFSGILSWSLSFPPQSDGARKILLELLYNSVLRSKKAQKYKNGTYNGFHRKKNAVFAVAKLRTKSYS
ncbi:hypothetical protein HMPREF0262_02035 [Clostridium sp. ATCC 29733]|nr:hypothetical protein HMPREF0262_02035 [Clostridium sp. ATCC 29733]